MQPRTPFFKNISTLDLLLAVLFVLVVALLANSLFPPKGWWIGVFISLLILYLAKRRRDTLQNPPGSPE